MTKDTRFIRWFSETGVADVPLVGGKNASLGEMYRELEGQGIHVPNGFAVTAEAYRYTLAQGDAWQRLQATMDGLDPSNVDDLTRRAGLARDIVYGAVLPPDLAAQILDAYRALVEQYGQQLTVAVRSSATAEDLPTASFAGQHEAFLNIAGEARVLDAVRRCYASLFKERAIMYRIENGFDHFKVFLSAGIMKMVRSDLASSGVAFSLDTESGFRDVVLINGAYGLGENVVQGTVDPDEFYVFKPTLQMGRRTVLRRTLGGKEIKMVYALRWPRHYPQCADAAAGPGPVLPVGWRSAADCRRGGAHRSALQRARRPPDADGYRMGQGRAGRVALHGAGAP